MSFAAAEYFNMGTVSDVMKTCRVLNHEGTRYLLQSGVRFHSGAQVLSFLTFIFPKLGGDVAETIARMRWIKYMSIDLFPPPSEIAARALRFFFQVASTGATLNFTRLHIHHAEKLLSTDEEMKDAIAGLQTIQELVITGAGERTFKLLCGLQSSLTNAEIVADADASRNVPVEDRDARQFLSRSMGRLETLSLSSSIVCSLEGPSYYAVRMLFLRDIEFPVTGHYTSAFPFLSLLSVEDCSVSYATDEQIDAHREENILSQTQHGSWRFLTSCNGPLFDMYILGLTCHVPDVELRQAHNELNPDILHAVELNRVMLHAVVADTRPVNLALSTDDAEFFLGGDFETFADLPEVRALQSLHLRFLPNLPRVSHLDMWEIMECILQVVSTLPVSAFRLAVDCSVWDDEDDDSESNSSEGSESTSSEGWQTSRTIAQSPVEVFSRTWDANAFVDRLMNLSDYLQTVKVILLRKESLDLTEESVVIVERGPNSDTAFKSDVHAYRQQRIRDASADMEYLRRGGALPPTEVH
ncbi:hypothetical protein C8Q74DRAFT_1369101 [Fomes fomentarius]|nr:hypothetical protein C8Q74DRAFT_1369101 [Fomes fomentarius]